MFEFAVYKYIKDNFDAPIGYGETPESTSQSYLIQNKLDKNEDPQLPCDGFGDSGTGLIQWQIYGKDTFTVDKLYTELNNFLYNINNLTFDEDTFIINSKNTNGRPSNVFNSQSAVGVLTMTFNYTKE